MRRIAFCLLFSGSLLHAAPDGKELFKQNCSMCHGAEGLGMAGVFPPLAKSDFIVNYRTKALKAPMEGLSGPITVNGKVYTGAMPTAFLDDEQLAAVFNYVFTSWGNEVPPVTVEEITKTRASSRIPTLAALKASMTGQSLPAAPEGWELKIGAELSVSPSRITLHPDGESVFALTTIGDVWQWKPGTQGVTKVIAHEDYIDPSLGESGVMGMNVDSKKRLYLVCNQCNKAKNPVINEMTIFRTEPWQEGAPLAVPKAWFKAENPYGIGPYNHGLSHIAEGPDGMLYINSGARTDSGEEGTQPEYSKAGETPTTATMWRMDPEAAKPEIEVIARGLRNSYGFCWDDDGHLVATENGPDAHPAEEFNLIEKGKHYGFPYKFSDWDTKPYPYTPDLPAGLEITLPFRNLGPDGGGNAKGLSSFDAHSCPTGMVWLGADWPAPFTKSFLTTRFGNMIKLDKDVGYDLQQLHVNFGDRTLTSHTTLAPLGRPVDILKLSGHRLVIAEYSMATTLAAGTGTPGRLLLLQPKK